MRWATWKDRRHPRRTAAGNRWVNWCLERSGGNRRSKRSIKKALRFRGAFTLAISGDFDGRIISNGFTTAKNFSDWILRFSVTLRQVKNRTQIVHRLNIGKIRALQNLWRCCGKLVRCPETADSGVPKPSNPNQQKNFRVCRSLGFGSGAERSSGHLHRNAASAHGRHPPPPRRGHRKRPEHPPG